MGIHENIFQQAGLIIKYLKGTLTSDEAAQFEKWRQQNDVNDAFVRRLEDHAFREETLAFLDGLDTDMAWEKVAARLEPARSQRWRPSASAWRVAAAIALVSTIGFSLYWFTYIKESHPYVQAESQRGNDVLPGGDKALLTMADGSVITLEDIEEGVIREENGILITKRDGQLVYEVKAPGPEEAVTFNTVSTPVGGQFRLLLPDGSQVWLNASSSIRFPTSFKAKERLVELTGEAYFEVSPYRRTGTETNAGIPFKVKAGQSVIEVLGTHFNVMAYSDEPAVQTTLLEGAVKIQAGKDEKVLQPGQQATVAGKISVREVDTDDIIAWKNGFFQFENAPLTLILKQLQRWYGVEIVNEPEIPRKHFTAAITRHTTLSQVLRMLELSGELQFEIVDKKIKITENRETGK